MRQEARRQAFEPSRGSGQPTGQPERARKPDFGLFLCSQPLTPANLYGILYEMKAIPYTQAREKLAATMEEVISNHAPVIITRNGSGSVVMLSLADFESMEETAYLMSSPANAARLNESIRALESGQGVVRKDARELLG